MKENNQFTIIVKENEKLISELEKLRNENNIIKIDNAEMKMKIQNMIADHKIELNLMKDLKEQINSLQIDLSSTRNKLDQVYSKYKALKFEIINVENQTNCKLNDLVKLNSRFESQSEEIEIYKREIVFLKNIKNRINTVFTPEDKIQSVLFDFYKSLSLSPENMDICVEKMPQQILSTNSSQDSFLLQKVSAYEEELISLREKLNQTTAFKENLIKTTKQSKETILNLTNEIEIMKQHSYLSENKVKNFDFKRAITNLEKFDQNLKSVYSCCIDLFVSLNKSVLIKMEKSLNDCIIEFKEIKELLLNKI